MAWTLAVLDQRRKCLIHQKRVWFVDVEAEQTEAACRAAADAIKELQSLTDNVVVSLVVLCAQEILQPQHTDMSPHSSQ